MNNKVKFAIISGLFALVFAPARADLDMLMYISESCSYSHDARKFIDNTLKYEYPMVHIKEIDIGTLDEKSGADYNNMWKNCGFPHGGVPIFVAGEKCVQGYGPAVESDKEIRDLLDGALSAEDLKTVTGNKDALAKNPEQFKASVNASALRKNGRWPIWYYSVTGLIVSLSVFGISFLLFRNRKKAKLKHKKK